VYIAPWFGPNGETVLVCLDDQKRSLDQQLAPTHARECEIADAMWDRLEGLEAARPVLRLVR
jgi:hypothetical protein